MHTVYSDNFLPFDDHDNPASWLLLLSSLFRWGTWGSEGIRNMSATEPKPKTLDYYTEPPPYATFYLCSPGWLLLCRSVAQSCPTLCDPLITECQASLTFTISWSLLKLMFIESVMPSNHLILCRSLLLPSIFPSIRVFSSHESVLYIRWPKYWSFSFSISPSNEYSELISFRIDWFDLLAVQGTMVTS